jgi:hypothetical protein
MEEMMRDETRSVKIRIYGEAKAEARMKRMMKEVKEEEFKSR